MPHKCECEKTGFCQKFSREQGQNDLNLCQNCFNMPQRALVIAEWYQTKLRSEGRMAGCVWKSSAILDEFGNHKYRRTCGCGGQASKIYLYECLHPQMPHAEDNCEGRCTNYFTV